MDSKIPYAWREEVKAALDVAETARRNAQVDRNMVAGARAVDRLCHRTFAPVLREMTFDWPNSQSPTHNRLWLDANELVSLTSMTSGGVTIAGADALLRPDDGPPFTHLETNDSTSAVFASGATTQRAITVTGLFGYRDDTADAGQLATGINSAVRYLDVTDGSVVGVGSLLRADDERMLVTGRTMITTGQTLQADLLDKNNAVTVTVQDGTGFAQGELILIDGERMRVDDIAGNALVVARAVDGSPLAAHTGNPVIYSPRRLLVDRAAAGTAAAAHSAGPLSVWVPPPLVRQLAIAETIVALNQETGGYGQQIRAGESAMKLVQSISDLRATVYEAHGRKVRVRAV